MTEMSLSLAISDTLAVDLTEATIYTSTARLSQRCWMPVSSLPDPAISS